MAPGKSEHAAVSVNAGHAAPPQPWAKVTALVLVVDALQLLVWGKGLVFQRAQLGCATESRGTEQEGEYAPQAPTSQSSQQHRVDVPR